MDNFIGFAFPEGGFVSAGLTFFWGVLGANEQEEKV
jgi:hypothetical protein